MKRWILAVVAILGPVVGLASADYIVIKIDLNKFFNNPSPIPDQKGPAGTGQYPPGGGQYNPYGGQGPQGGQRPAGGDGDLKNPAYQIPQGPPLWAYAYLELRKPAEPHYQGLLYKIENRWGKAPLYVPTKAITQYVKMSSAAKRFDDKFKNDLREGKTPEKLLSLAEWALERGLLTEFQRMMDELRALDAKAPIPPPLKAILKAVDDTRDALKVQPTRDDPAAADLIEELTKDEYQTVQSEGGHYTLLTNVRSPRTDAGVKRRLTRMEETYQGFFFWFALKGQARPVPTHRLVTVLVKTDWNNTKDFDNKHVVFDLPPMVGDGFTARRDNVVVLASTRLDEAYYTLLKNNQQLFTQQFKVSGTEVLNEPKLDRKRTDLMKPPGPGRLPPLYNLQALMLLQHAMEEEAEVATVSHECTRQLIATTGLIPRNVNTGEWAQFGLASFFETAPRGFHGTFGGANWTELIRFKYLFKHVRKNGKTDPEKARNVLLNVIGDKYFQEGYQAQRQLYEISADREALEPKATKQLRLARSSAWALTDYLAREHTQKLLRYYQELSNLPRDVEYDADVLRNCFARAFNLLTPARTLDMARVEKLAVDWFGSMEARQLDMYELEQEELRQLAAADAPPPAPKTTGPGGQGGATGPGGNPYPGGTTPYGPGGTGGYGPGGSGGSGPGGSGGYVPPGYSNPGGGGRPGGGRPSGR
jgi:hypothetical protein